MADNVTINTLTGSPLAATDEVSYSGNTANVQLVRPVIVTGAEGSRTVIDLGGDATNGLDVDVTRVIPGTGATELGKAEDAVHASGDVGVLAMTVRQNTAAALSGTDGDYQPQITDTNGRLHVIAALAATQTLTTVTTVATVTNVATIGTSVTPGTAAANLGKAEDAAHTSGDTGVMALAVRQDTLATLSSATGDYEPLHLNVVGALYTQPVGAAAHDAVIAGNPLRLAGRALTADYTAVAAGDTADLITTLTGKLVTIPLANPANTWSYAAAAGGLVNATGVTARAAGAAGVRNYISSIQVVNSHQTISTEVLVRDGAAGTVLHRGWAQAAGGGFACTFEPPLRGTAATLVEIGEVTATATAGVLVNLSGFAAAE